METMHKLELTRHYEKIADKSKTVNLIFRSTLKQI
jgi:hypothetical protein